jgi:hypothetical protein
MRKLCICYDSRENYPLIWPATFFWRPDTTTTVFAVTVKRTRLKTADYFVDGCKKACLIERKASVSELRANLFGAARKRWNFLQSLDRMAGESDHPYLFLDMTWKEVAQDWDEHGRPVLRYPVGLYSHLMQELFVRGIGLLGPIPARTVSQRRLAGSFLLDVMLAHIYPRRSLSADGIMPICETGGDMPVMPNSRQRGDRLKALKFQKLQDSPNPQKPRA